jgi:hypothetical protein
MSRGNVAPTDGFNTFWLRVFNTAESALRLHRPRRNPAQAGRIDARISSADRHIASGSSWPI